MATRRLDTAPSLLVNLPASIARIVLFKWLPEEALVKVDSAFCNFSERIEFLELLSKQIASKFTVTSRQPSFSRLSWRRVRSIGCASFDFDSKVNLATTQLADICASITSNASILTRVNISGTREVVEVLVYLLDLLNVSLTQIGLACCDGHRNSEPLDLDTSMKKLLKNSSEVLKQLHVEVPVEWHSHVPNGVHFPVLHGLSVRVRCDEDLLTICAAAPNLSNVYMNAPRCSAVGLAAIGQHCHGLLSFEMWVTSTISNVIEGVMAIAQGCMHLKRLLLYDCSQFDDSGLTAIATHCTQLEELILDYTAISDASLILLAHSTNANTLRSVSVQGAALVTGEGIVAIAAHCNLLRKFDLSHIDGLTTANLKLVFPHLKNITGLKMAGYNVDDEMLVSIAEHIPSLQQLDIQPIRQHACTAYGLTQIALKCEKLRELTLGKRHEDVNTLTVALWKALRPGLVVSYRWQ